MSPVRRRVLVLLVLLGLLLLEGLPRLRGRAEALYEAERLAPGMLLEATWRVGRPFDDAVVLLVAHGEEGSMGLVVSGGHSEAEPLSPSPGIGAIENGGGVWDGRSAAMEAGLPEGSVGWGGPVGPENLWLLSPRPLEGIEHVPGRWLLVADGIWLLKVRDAIEAEEIMAALSEAKLFAGHSGWGPGQLAGEVRGRGWRVTVISAKSLFGAEAVTW